MIFIVKVEIRLHHAHAVSGSEVGYALQVIWQLGKELASLLTFASAKKNSLLASLLTVSAIVMPAAYTDRLATRKASHIFGFGSRRGMFAAPFSTGDLFPGSVACLRN